MFSKVNPATEHEAASSHVAAVPRRRLWLLTLGCVGVVYGDIGTSPLYAFRVAMVAARGDDAASVPEVLGVLSLIIWALILVVTIKYVFFLLYADNRGEGGTLSLMALVQRKVSKAPFALSVLGIIGAALFFGDAAITPAISVLSAVEGLGLVTPALNHAVMPLTLFILICLFMAQKKGTARVSFFFGPITTIWFLTMAATGISWIVQNPAVLASFNPYYALNLIFTHSGLSFLILGAVFLAVTGAEALYTDLGHFGRRPIQRAWLLLVFPCLVLNYLGQGALVLTRPETIANPFFLLVPEWALLPFVGLATLATIVASQATITGAYSIVQQAIQLGFLPRMEIRHTSAEQEGQIYIPKVNRLLLTTVLFLCVIFGSSAAIANAYGIAVSGTMLVTTIMAFFVVWKVWKKNVLLAAALVVPLLCIEAVFFSANMARFLDGGFVPLLLSTLLTGMMVTWVMGSRFLFRQTHNDTISLSDLMEKLDREPLPAVEGTAIFLTSDPVNAPVALLQNIRHNKVLHRHNVVLTILNAHVPKIPDAQRTVIDYLSSNMTRVIISFGFMETPDVPRALTVARGQGLDVDLDGASYFLGRRTIVADAKRGLPLWQDHIYIAMAHGASNATEFYRIPHDQVVELGVQMAV